MRLYDYFRSSAAFRVRIALNLKGLAPERSFIHLRRDEQNAPEYRRINRQGLVPTLEIDGAFLTQSLAIIEYLDETYPQPPLLPSDPLGRARVRSIAQAIACDIHPLNNTRVLSRLASQFGADDAARDAWYHHWIMEGLAALEAITSNDPETGIYCHGDSPTLADICLVPQLFNARRFNVALAPYPTLTRIEAECMKLPAFADAQPGRQPDAE